MIVTYDDIDSIVENLIEYSDRYFGRGRGDEDGIKQLIVDAENILEGEIGWDDRYLRKVCRKKFYDWKGDMI